MSRPLVLDTLCCVTENSWLVAGWSLLTVSADFSRDFLFPCLSKGFHGVLSVLTVKGPETVSTTAHTVLDTSFAALVHAFRLGFPKEDRDFFGGWSAQAGEKYARAARRKVINRQRTVVNVSHDLDSDRLAEIETSLMFEEYILSQRGF